MSAACKLFTNQLPYLGAVDSVPCNGSIQQVKVHLSEHF